MLSGIIRGEFISFNSLQEVSFIENYEQVIIFVDSFTEYKV